MDRKIKNNSSFGFTIVELLIVIVIIGILAAIVIVAYNGITDEANDSSVKSDLVNIGNMISIYKIEHGEYPFGSADWESIKAAHGLKVATGAYSEGLVAGGGNYNLVYCWPSIANPDIFAVVAQSKSGNVFENRNGMVRQASYSFVDGSPEVCSNAGAPIDHGTARDWFYSQGSWTSYAE